jgi:anti-anti-sigma factor
VIGASAASRHAGAPPPADRAIVLLRGALDAAGGPALRDRLTGILHHGTRLLILDLSRVLSCDPAGLAVLIATQRRARLLGTTVCLAAPTLPVANLLRSTGLDRRFTIYPNLSSALAPGTIRPARTAPAPPAAAIVSPGYLDPARDRKRILLDHRRRRTANGRWTGLQALRPALPGGTSGNRQLARR